MLLPTDSMVAQLLRGEIPSYGWTCDAPGYRLEIRNYESYVDVKVYDMSRDDTDQAWREVFKVEVWKPDPEFSGTQFKQGGVNWQAIGTVSRQLAYAASEAMVAASMLMEQIEGERA